MSGPKVVRVVTREEQEAAARLHLERVDAALHALTECARRHGVLDAQLAAHLDGRRERLGERFRQGAWAALQREAPAEVAFLTAERERIRADAVRAAEAARARGVRTEGAARTLLAAFASAGREPPGALREVAAAARGAGEAELARLERALAEAFRALVPPQRPGATPAQHALAARLGAGQEGQRFEDWWAAQPQRPAGEADARLEALLAEVEALEDAEVARPFLERARAILREAEPGRRALLTDSLVLELGAHRRARREREAARARLEEARRGLAALATPAARALAARLEATLGAGAPQGAEALLAQAQATLEAERRALAAAARRRAVLEGLAALGYEVREAMEVAWAREGRLVVRKPGAPDYGVELGAPPDAARLQVRLVGAERPLAPRDAQRDRDMEALWCGDFQRLREGLASGGTDVAVERALEVGAQPVKSVALEAPAPEEASVPAAAPRQRTVR